MKKVPARREAVADETQSAIFFPIDEVSPLCPGPPWLFMNRAIQTP
jgi:hypothetical protein